MMRGWHDEDCPLEAVTFHTYPEDGWTVEILTERWNRRADDAGELLKAQSTQGRMQRV